MYYDVSFIYPGPTSNSIDDTFDESMANLDAGRIVMNAGKTLQLNMKHAYGWPDGSLWKFIKTDLSIDTIRDSLNLALEDNNISVGVIVEKDPASDPWKAGSKTLEDYFNK